MRTSARLRWRPASALRGRQLGTLLQISAPRRSSDACKADYRWEKGESQ